MNWGDVFAVRRLRVQVGWLLVFVCLFLLSSRGWCAQAQTFVTEDGQVIVGEVVMEGENAIAVRTARGTVSLSKSELLDVSPEEAIAYGLIWDGRKARAKGEEAQTADDLGAAVYYYRLAVDRLDAVSSDATEQFASAQSLAEEIEARAEEIENSLAERGLAAYKMQVFEKSALDFHLGNGHVLVGKATWVEPSQVCGRCQGKRWIVCAACSGTGRVQVDCPYCTGGLRPNPVGNGTGTAVCPDCAGSGHVRAVCPSCRGSGQVGCAKCRGKGTTREKCKACDGKGYIKRKIKVRDGHGNTLDGYEKVECTECGGTGRVDAPCEACGGTGHVTCRRCRGEGKITVRCPRCRGCGTISVPKTIQCTHCHFGWIQKACEVCRGKGYVPCPDCGGRGFTGDPIPDPGS